MRPACDRIVTADPHAYNALKHDYKRCAAGRAHQPGDGPRGEDRSNPAEAQRERRVYTYHDPCYLGRHNGVYEDPRDVLDSIPGLQRVEMKRCRDRSFCCGGGGLALFYEAKEEQRMGVRRVRMAAEAGASVIVTACPFCMVNIEDAIKVAGMEGQDDCDRPGGARRSADGELTQGEMEDGNPGLRKKSAGHIGE